MKASTQWHDPGLFAVLISMPRSDIRFNRFICGGSLYTESPPDVALHAVTFWQSALNRQNCTAQQ